MADITYTTMAAVSETDKGGWPRVFNKGGTRIVQRTPTLGIKTPFYSDSTWDVSDTGYINDAEAVTFSGNNGLEHYESYKFGNNGSIFVPGRVLSGVQVESTQNSTAGHGIFLSRIGLIFRNDFNHEHFWGGATRSRPNRYDKHVYLQNIDQATRSALSDYVLDSLVVELSTKGGSGSRTTEVKIGGFKLLYSVGPSSMRWVVGAMRKREEAFGEGSIQLI